MKAAIQRVQFLASGSFVGYLLATGAVYYASVICRKMLSREYPDDPVAVDRIMIDSGFTFQGLMIFVLIPYVPLVVLAYRQIFRR
jgi:hypothetical protein